MMKRIIALLLALILTVGLLPTVALAAEGDGETSSTNAEVVIGKYNDKDQWEPGTPTSTLPDGVKTVSKTAKPTTNANEYEVTLQVVLQQTEENSGKAATVLVLDTSGSMAYCAECGAEPEEDCEHNYVKFDDTPNSSTKYYYKTTDKNGREKFDRAYYCDGNHTKQNHNAGWFNSSKYRKHTDDNRLADNNIYVETTRTSRLDAAKVAAENFLKTYSGLTFKTDGTPANNQNNRNLGRYVSVVSFASGAAPKHNWIDVSNANNYQSVLNKIKALEPDGGTNLDAGLTYAEYLLKQTTVKDAVKNVIALTDGQPTYCLKKNCSDLLHLFNAELTIGNTKYCVHGNGKQCTDEIYNSTVATATRVKNVPSKIYTVCFDAGETIDVPDSQKKISVSEYLSTKIATQPTKTGEQFAYDASNAEQLYAEFAKITQSIVSGLNNGTVKDILPAGITVSEADKQKFGTGTWELNSDVFTKTEAKVTDKDKDGKTVTTYTYTYTYTVKIDPKTVKTEKVDGVDYAPLNGETTLTVKNSAGENVTIHFPIPAGKVTMPSYTVTWKSQDGSTLETDNDVEYNTKPTFNSDAPTKADDAQYTYTFVGWATEANRENGTPEADLPAVTDDVTYYAAFSKTPRTYTVTWMPQDGQGNAYETDTGVAYNARPSYDSEVPTKAADDKYTYTFAGWATTTNQTSGSTVDALPNVTENVTYYAAFSATPRTYTVTYTDGVNGTAFAVQTTSNVAYSAPIPAFNGDTPTREGYNFNGWTSNVEGVTPSSTMPASDVTFTAQWKEKDKVTIKYVAKDGGTVTLANETLNPDTGTAAGSTATANTGYRFVGWYDNSECTGTALSKDASYTPLKPEAGWADKTYYAKFESLTYTITFKTENGGTINDQTNDITHPGLTAGTTFPAVPTTEANNGYYFLGWYDESGNKVEENAFPKKVTGNATYTAKWKKYDSVTLNLTGRFQKELTSDTATLPENANSFTLNIKNDNSQTVAQAHVLNVPLEQKSSKYTGTKAFAVESGSEMTFNAAGTYIYTVAEAAGSISGMSYDDTTYTMTVEVVANEGKLTIQSATIEGGTVDTVNLLAAEGTNSITFHNEYTKPKKSINLGDLIQKDFDKKTGSEDLPTGSSYTFRVRAYERFQKPDGSYSYSDAPYLGEVVMTEFGQKNFVFNNGVITFFEHGTHEYVVEEFNDGAENVEYDSNRYLLVLDVADDLTITARNAGSLNDEVSTQSVEQTPVITFCNKYNKEKDPDKLTINFADYVQKELTATGTKTASDVNFTVDVKEFKTVISSIQGDEEVNTYAGEQLLSTTLTARFDSITGGETKTAPFNGSIVVEHAGTYSFELTEEDGQRTGVTYDDSTYKVYVYVKREGDKLVVGSFNIYKDYKLFDGNTITFHNTIDTGKDDYYPIIIPTIINKDTGMLNKTDHFAYVIGYPDGTVHPNGQITRAEVATIFFRLLRDEVRDGAFTTSNSYSDVAYGKWYNNPISTMSALGIITGYPDGTFKPNKPITRAEFAAIAARFDETQSGKSATFSDVIGHWAAKEIGIAYYNDWIKGYPDGTFKPDQNITRAEAMTLINRVLERKPESPADLLTNMNKWTDNMDTSKWYYLDVQEATNSHGYTRKTFNYELWRQMLPDPDWSRYER